MEKNQQINDDTKLVKNSDQVSQQVTLLNALNAAAATLQHSARTADDVFAAVREQIAALGLRGGLALYNDNNEHLVILAASYPRKKLERIEKLTGIQAEGFTFSAHSVDICRLAINTRDAVFTSDSHTIATQLFPERARPYAERVLNTFGSLAAIAVPVISNENVQGVLAVAGADLTHDDMPAMTAFANHIAIALENARIHKQLISQRVDEQVILLRLSQALLAEVDFRTIAEYAVVAMTEYFKPDLCKVLLLDEGRQQLQLVAGQGWQVGLVGQALVPTGTDSQAGFTLVSKDPIIVEDFSQENRFQIPQLLIDHAVVAGVSAPMLGGERPIGVLGVHWRRPCQFSKDEVRLLSLIANQAAQAIERTWLFDDERKRREELVRTNTRLTALSHVAAQVQKSNSLAEIFETLGDELGKIGITCLIGLSDPIADAIVVRYSSIESKILSTAEQLAGQSLLGFRISNNLLPEELSRRGQGIFSDAVETTQKVFPKIPKMILEKIIELVGITSDMAVAYIPMKGKEVQIGVLAVWGPGLQEADYPALEIFAAQASAALEQARLYEEIRVSEEKFSKAFMASPDSVIISTLDDGRYVDVNESFLQTTGYQRAEIIGRTSAEFSIWADPVDRDEFVRLLQEQGEVRDYETCFRKKSGEEGTALMSSEIIEIDGKPFLLTISRDITEHKRAEEALQESNRRYDALFNHSTDAVFILSLDGVHLDANQRAADMLGYELEELIGKSAEQIIAPQEYPNSMIKLETLLSGQNLPIYERIFRRKDGSAFPVEISLMLSKDDQGQPRYIQSIVRDITERKQQDATRQRYEFIANTARDLMTLVNREYIYEAANDAYCQALDKHRHEIIGRSVAEIWGSRPLEREIKSRFDRCFGGEEVHEQIWLEYPALGWRYVDTTYIPFRDGDGEINHAVVLTRDITEKERVEAEVRGLAKFPDENPNPVLRVVPDGSIIFANQAARPLTESCGCKLGDLLPEKLLKPALAAYQYGVTDVVDIEVDDWVFSFAFVPVIEAGYLNIYGRDVTERVQAESEIRQRTWELNRLYRASGALVSSGTNDLSSLAQAIVEVVLREFGQSNCSLFLDDPDSPDLIRAAAAGPYATEVSMRKLTLNGPGLVPSAISSGEIVNVLNVRANPDYIPNWEAANSEMAVPLKIGERVIGAIDIQSAELGAFSPDDERLMTAFAERAALALERQRSTDALQKFSRVMEQTADSVVITDPEGLIEYVNPSFEAQTGYSGADVIGKKPSILKSGKHETDIYKKLWNTILDGEIFHDVLINKKKNGSMYYEEKTITPLKDVQGKIIHFVSTGRDITARIQSDEEIRRRAAHLEALHTVDMAISGSVNLDNTLGILLEEVTAQLEVDAAAVLIYDSSTQMLKFKSQIGFYTDALQYTQLKLGEGYAGRAALEGRIIHIPDLTRGETGFLLSPLLSQEKFVAYCGVPLIAKGQIQGVLEVFHRSPLERNPEWGELLDALATQAAIAIDNATLFHDLQRSNEELVQAYNTTLEGWAKALELRDEETEGHTRRVTSMTERLAREIGMSEAEMIQVHRGALLHDIGKMGVPDSILLKPSKLTEGEWEIMRQHPVYAYSFISQIEYLAPAVDIPYCHHEKWDGSGYPRGLKGEQIPLSARIFAVIDVWDALTSDRPYRKAWEQDRVKEYIQEQVGKHFDPTVVEKFMPLIAEDQLS